MKDAIADGMDPNRIAFMSFSKKAAEEAKTRAIAELDVDSRDLIWFRTLHSLAFNCLGMRGQDVFKGVDFHKLGELVGLEFKANASNNMSDGVLFIPGGGGDKYLSMVQEARVREVTLEQQFNDAADYNLHFQQLRVLAKAYEDLKKELRKRDFVDMIEDFIEQGTSPRFDLLIIDEAQDLAPLQWRMVKEVLVPNSKQVYYAGDDDQCIYSWMGVRVSDFLGASDSKMVLDKSYRVPLTVHKFADQLVRRVATRQEKVWQPVEREGNLSWHRDIMELDLESGEWLILTRTNYIANKIASRLKDDGYLFWREGAGWSLSQNVLDGIEVWLKLCKGQDLSAEELKKFSKNTERKCYYQIWAQNPRIIRPRTILYPRRLDRTVRTGCDGGDAVDVCPESVGQGGRLYYVGTAAGGEITIWQTEDPDIDDSQSQRWRGG